MVKKAGFLVVIQKQGQQQVSSEGKNRKQAGLISRQADRSRAGHTGCRQSAKCELQVDG